MVKLFIFWWILIGLGNSEVLFDFSEKEGDWASLGEGNTLNRLNCEFSIQNGHLRYRGDLLPSQLGNHKALAIRTVQRELDLSSYRGIQLKVKGDGKTYALDLASMGKPSLRHLQYRFATSGEWQVIQIPFDELLAAENMGYGMQASDIDIAELNVLGFVIDKGQTGHFELLIDEISLY